MGLNRDDVERLLKLRRELLAESLNNETVAAWTLALPSDLTYAAARDAMVLACRQSTNGRVNLGALLAQLPHQDPSRTHTAALGADGCPECDGCGFSEHRDVREPGVVRWAPCGTCRPSELAALRARADHSQSGRGQDTWHGPTDEGRAAIAHIRGRHGWDEVKAAPTFKVMEPQAVAARKAWWKAGRPGHYPGCTCDRCAHRIAATQPEPIGPQPDGVRTVPQSITDVPLPTARAVAVQQPPAAPVATVERQPDTEPF